MTTFKSELSGPNAFYKKAVYYETTEKDFASQTALSPTYVWNSESKIQKIFRQTFSNLFFPILGYQLLHNLVGKLVVPAASPCWKERSKHRLNYTKQLAIQDAEWKYKRLTIEVDGMKIDTLIFGKENTLDNGRWMVMAGGNGQFYEDSLSHNSELKRLLPQINSNAILFNYPGVLASEGHPNRQAMAKAHRAVLSFLENEIQAKNIIVYGHSIGGGVQGDVIKSHTLHPSVNYIFIKSRTFSSLSTTAYELFSRAKSRLVGNLVAITLYALGWNMQPLKASTNLAAREIILQTASSKTCSPLRGPQDIINDGVIPKEATYAKALLEKDTLKENKVVLGIPEHHNTPLSNETLEILASEINTALQ